MGNIFYWRGGADDFGAASSWDTYSPDTDDPSGFGIANRPPSATDTAVINAAGSIFGTGSAYELDINTTASISGTTNIATYTIIGESSAGDVSVFSTWHNTSFLAVGNYNFAGSLTI